MDKEIWKPIKNYTYYEVSNFGRVRSLDRCIKNRMSNCTAQHYFIKGKVLSLNKKEKARGYLSVILCENNIRKRRKVHQLVLEAFVGDRPLDTEVCHFDGNPSNNFLNNLRYDTKKNNAQDTKRLNRYKPKFGEANHNSKLKTEDIIEIKKHLKSGIKNIELATKFKVDARTISQIKCGINWKQVQI